MAIEIGTAENGAAQMYIWGGIDYPDHELEIISSSEFVSALRALSRDAGRIDVNMSSIGGDVMGAVAMVQGMRESDSEIHMHSHSKCYSAATLAMQGGKSRTASSLAIFMVHGPNSAICGSINEAEAESLSSGLKAHREVMEKIYQEANIKQEQIDQWMMGNKDWYYPAQKAAEIGLIDEVTESDKSRAPAAFSNHVRMINACAHTVTLQRPIMEPNNPPAPAPSNAQTELSKPSVQTITATGGDQTTAVWDRAEESGRSAGAEAENHRIGEILALKKINAFQHPRVQAVLDAALSDVRCDAYLARERAHDALAALPESEAIQSRQPGTPDGSPWDTGASAMTPDLGGFGRPGRLHVSGGERRYAEGLELALSIRAGIEKNKKVIARERRGNELLSRSMTEIIAMELRAAGQPCGGTKTDLVTRYVNTIGVIVAAAGGPSQGSDHLPTVLGNIANKTAMMGWEQADETWRTWVVMDTLSNYQPHTRGNIALLDKLEKMLPGEPWNFGKMKDVKQSITGFFHGLAYSLPIQAIVNDELGELTRAMMQWGESASATVGDTVFLILTAAGGGGFGQLLDEDGKPVFHADHNNVAASGAIPSEDTVNAGRAAMATQTDPNARTVGIRPRYIQFGPALFQTVTKLLNSTEISQVALTGGDATVETGRNSVQAMNLVPVEEYRFGTSKLWHLLANRRTVEVSGVEGQVQPRVESTPMQHTPGLSYTLSMPFGASALDFRGMYRDAGE